MIIDIISRGVNIDTVQLDRSFSEEIDLSNWRITLPVDKNNDVTLDEFGNGEIKQLLKFKL